MGNFFEKRAKNREINKIVKKQRENTQAAETSMQKMKNFFKKTRPEGRAVNRNCQKIA